MISGTVAAGYEAVEEQFAENFASRNEVGAACAVTVDGELVVDLWGGDADPKTKRAWQEDTMVNVFSTTKGVSSLALAHAHSQGMFDYDEKVSTYWPEFAAKDKEDITVRQLLSHQAGLSAIDATMNLDTLADPDLVAAALASQAPAWMPGSKHGYHGISLGWYESELIRRVDPQHRTIGQYFADEIATPLGIEFYIGLPDDIPSDRVAPVLGDWFRTKMVLNISKLPSSFVIAFLNPRSLTARTFANPKVVGMPHRYNDPEMQRIELPASNGIGTARAIAIAYGEFATGGDKLGIKPDTLSALTEAATPPTDGRFDQVLQAETTFSLGYCKPWPGFEFGSDKAFGTMGAGGSFGYADPELGLGFGYVMNRMDFYLWDDPREHALREAAATCAKTARG